MLHQVCSARTGVIANILLSILKLYERIVVASG
jgi:hypothetical protein